VGSEPPFVPQSESELLEFFELALDLMAIAGFDGYCKRVNPAYERTLGYPLRELLSRPYWEFIHPEDLPSAGDAPRRRPYDLDTPRVGRPHRAGAAAFA
jgi:PAS domain-containing protein